MTFSNPGWLWGLFGLMLPIAIHLLSRKEGKVIYIGSLRHLTDSDTAQFSSIKLNEILLLILRMLLITTLVLIFAGLNFKTSRGKTAKWLLIEDGIQNEAGYKGILDTLRDDGYELRYLAEGFPLVNDSLNGNRTVNYYSLITQLHREELDSAIILSYNYVGNFRGRLSDLPTNTSWLAVEPRPKTSVIDAVQINRDSVFARVAQSTSSETNVQSQRTTRNALAEIVQIDFMDKVRKPDTINIAIFFDDGYDYDRKILTAALLAIDEFVGDAFAITTVQNTSAIPDDADVTFWLSSKPVNRNVPNIVGISACANQFDLPLIVARNLGVNYCAKDAVFERIITKRLDEEKALAEALPFEIAEIIFNVRGMETHIKDQRSLANAAVWADGFGSKILAETNADQENPNRLLYILVLVFLLSERVIALKRKQ
jgi:ribosomal protein S26